MVVTPLLLPPPLVLREMNQEFMGAGLLEGVS